MSAPRTAFAAFCATHGSPSWEDIITGYDFGLLNPSEIQAWVTEQGPAAQRLRALTDAALETFEAHLWAACAEAIGKTPRPGSTRWALAQDRWREVLLWEALATEITEAQLAIRVERLYEQVGCPEDMLGLLKPSQAWSGTPATVDPTAVQRFLNRTRDGARRYGAAS